MNASKIHFLLYNSLLLIDWNQTIKDYLLLAKVFNTLSIGYLLLENLEKLAIGHLTYFVILSSFSYNFDLWI